MRTPEDTEREVERIRKLGINAGSAAVALGLIAGTAGFVLIGKILVIKGIVVFVGAEAYNLWLRRTAWKPAWPI